MRMGGALAAILIVTAACGASSAAPSTSTTSAGPRCGPRQARTLAADRRARIYVSANRVYGCATRSYLLGSYRPRVGQAHVGRVALAGTVAAYAATQPGVDTALAQVIVRRLDDGRMLRELSAVTRPIGPESFESVDSLVVKADGAVAWIAGADSIVGHGSKTEVDSADKRGTTRLDSGRGIAKASLRLRGSHLSWHHDRTTRSATLM